MVKWNVYHDEHLPALTAALATWIKTAGDYGYCHAGEVAQRIHESNRVLPAAERVTVWTDEEGIAGFCLNLRFDNAIEVYAHPRYRGTSSELTMLLGATDESVRLMHRLGRDASTVIIDVWACDTVRQDMLRSLDFKRHQLWGYLAEQSLDKPIAAPLLPDGFYLRAATWAEAEALATLRNAAFGDDLSAEDYRATVMQAGYDPENERVVVAPDGRLAGSACLLVDAVNQTGLIEPLVVHPDFQRLGLGRALLLHGMQRMQQAGMQIAVIGYDAANTAAMNLYTSVGFRTRYTTEAYRRDMSKIPKESYSDSGPSARDLNL